MDAMASRVKRRKRCGRNERNQPICANSPTRWKELVSWESDVVVSMSAAASAEVASCCCFSSSCKSLWLPGCMSLDCSLLLRKETAG